MNYAWSSVFWGKLNPSRAIWRKPNRWFLLTLLFLSFLTIPSPASASRHYVDLPAYGTRLSDYLVRNTPQQNEVIITVGPPDHPTPFLLDRNALCRIDYFSGLFCSGFKESHSQRIHIPEEMVQTHAFLHLVDLIYLDHIEVSTDAPQRLEDLNGLLELASSHHFSKMRPKLDAASLAQRLLLPLDPDARLVPEAPGALEFSETIREHIFSWIAQEPFKPNINDMKFLSSMFLRTYNEEILRHVPAEDYALIVSKRSMLLKKLSALSPHMTLNDAEETRLFEEIGKQSPDEALKKQLVRKIQNRPNTKGLFIRLGYDLFES